MQKHAEVSQCAPAFVLLLLTIMGCSAAQQSPQPLSKFDVRLVTGILSHDIVLSNKNHRNLEKVDLTVTVYYENTEHTVARHWAFWKHGQEQTVNVPTATTRVQRVVIKGNAVAGAEKKSVELTSEFLFSYDGNKQ